MFKIYSFFCNNYKYLILYLTEFNSVDSDCGILGFDITINNYFFHVFVSLCYSKFTLSFTMFIFLLCFFCFFSTMILKVFYEVTQCFKINLCDFVLYIVILCVPKNNVIILIFLYRLLMISYKNLKAILIYIPIVSCKLNIELYVQ